MLAVVSAMPEEICGVLAALTNVRIEEFGRRQFHSGLLFGEQAVVVFSRWGKVAAAATIAQLLGTFPITRLVFGGVAGAIDPDLSIGDVVVASELLQHDMDASPLFSRYEVPLLGKARFTADPLLVEQLAAATQAFLREDLPKLVADGEREYFRMHHPRIMTGLVASGDKFFAKATEVAELRQRLPELMCVEMEGAAVAQVCHEYATPFAVLRTISDTADENAVDDFPRFSRQVAQHYLAGVLARLAKRAPGHRAATSPPRSSPQT